MKNSLVRGFVVALAIVGFTASSVASSHKSTQNSVASSGSLTVHSVPLCAPSDPTHCGMD